MSRKSMSLSLVLSLVLLVLTFAVGGGTSSVKSAAQDPDKVPKADWRSLSQKKIFFGHMSVGLNILDGLRDLMQAQPGADLNVRETSDPGDFGKPIFAHSPIGKNGYPLSKIEDFRKFLESGVGEKADIAFFKFCFVDIHGGTDVEALGRAFDKAIQDLQTRFPKLTIAVTTAPLTVVPANIMAALGTTRGQPANPDIAANIKREMFNAHLREKYGKRVFDLAALESTMSNGDRTSFIVEGKTFYALNPSYSDDGGHLTRTGSRLVAASLLRFLAGLNSEQ